MLLLDFISSYKLLDFIPSLSSSKCLTARAIVSPYFEHAFVRPKHRWTLVALHLTKQHRFQSAERQLQRELEPPTSSASAGRLCNSQNV
jgi:hypothetical protein